MKLTRSRKAHSAYTGRRAFNRTCKKQAVHPVRTRKGMPSKRAAEALESVERLALDREVAFSVHGLQSPDATRARETPIYIGWPY